MKSITELEAELALAKKQELKKKWDDYLDRVKSFIERLQGKTVIAHYCNGGFNLFKVTGYKEQYYGDREGAYGQWSPCRWIEIQTSSYITCRVANDRGHWFRGEITHPDISTFKAIVYKGGSFPKNMEMTKIEFNDGQVSNDVLSTIKNSVRIGYTEYNEYRDDPNYDRAMDSFLIFTQIAPEGMWERAKEIADDNFMKTKKFWEEFQPKCKGLKSLYTEVPL